MKTVFTNSQLAHVWAQLSQPNGRSGSMFFEGAKLYSYGLHYLLAQVHTVKGRRFALINETRYSNTTCKHRYDAWRAVMGLMPYFDCSNPSNPKQAVKDLDKAAAASIAACLRVMKVTDADEIKNATDEIGRRFSEANSLRVILGMAQLKPKAKDIAAVKAHLTKRLTRWNELAPQRAAKIQQELINREKQRLDNAIKQSQKIEAWKIKK